VVAVYTHEWIADIGGNIPADYVLSSVLGIDPAGYTDQEKLSMLNARGYPPYHDGYLDYLDISFSSPIYLDKNSVSAISYDHNVNDSIIVWKGDLKHTFGQADFYALLPADTGAGPAYAKYRIWLKPSFLVKDIENKRAFPECKETGFIPSITFDNTVIQNYPLNPLKITVGNQSLHTVDSTRVIDSAAPVLSKVLYIDNKCDPNKTQNEVEIHFSEPIKKFSEVKAGITVRDIRAFTVRKSGQPATENSTFMDMAYIVTKGIEIVDKPDRGNPYEGARFNEKKQYIMCYRLHLNPDTSASINLLSNIGNEMQLTIMAQPIDHQTKDAANVSGNGFENVWVEIRPGLATSMVACTQNQITQADIHDALRFRWLGDDPLFPWWGATIVNYNATELNDSVPPLDIYITIHIFDILGNLVASPEYHPCLQLTIPGTIFRSPENDDKYLQTFSIDYPYVVQKAGIGGFPCGIVVAWNGLNNKGRLVAPGGYIVKMIINNQILEPSESTLKLIMTNRGAIQ
jgi:hypothetical protein